MPRPLKKSPPLAPTPEDRVHVIYSALLSLLECSTEHRAALNARGFSNKEIDKANYRSLPIRRREVVDKLANLYDNDLAGVPGFWRDDKGNWELAGKSGVLIPVRDEQGRIAALKVRVDKPSNPSQKYLLISSNPKQDKGDGSIKYPNGTPARALVHWPMPRPKTIDTFRITEGELKADIATSLTNQYTVAIPGIGAWRLALEAAKASGASRVLIAFDSDKNKVSNAEGVIDAAYKHLQKAHDFSSNEVGQYEIGKALASLYLSLEKEGIAVEIEDWPEKAGKGIDDVLMGGHSDLIRTMPIEEAQAYCKKMLAADIPDGWIYVIGTKRFIHSSTLIELDKEQYSDRYCHEDSENPSYKALRNPAFPKVDLPVYMPLKPMVYSEGARSFFNLWRPSLVKPKPGSTKLLEEHCEYMFPDPDERSMVLDWLAFCVQNPGKKIHWALLIQGVQGTGKSYFGWLMKQLLGAHNVSSPSNDIVHEVFTAWQKACQLIVIEEIMARGRLDLMNKFKPMITQETTIVREMHKPAYEQPNVFNILMFTNHEDAIIIDEMDRRYGVVFSKARPQPSSYYDRLWTWSQSHISAILDFFLSRDLSAFNPRGHAPMTKGKKELINISLTPLQAWMKESIETESWPFLGDLVSVSHLLECLPNHVKGHASMQGVGKALKGLGCQQLGQIRLSSGSSARLWTVRRHEVWASADEATVAQEYDKWSKNAQPGGNPHNPIADARPM